jgi:uncharacterized protein with NAD-binding domain and iron-sulfur cluster
MSETFQPKKIAILGGGMASLTTAYELTSQPGWNNLYEITIYQTGWRLGGKCATGRNVERHTPHQEPDYRIQEHGLHIFFGFYENTFRLLDKCYQEQGGNGPFCTIDDAFKKHSLIVLEEYIRQQWVNLPFEFPTDDLAPWEVGKDYSLWQHICKTLKFVVQIYLEIDNNQPQSNNNDCLEKLNRQLEIVKEVLEFLSADGLLLVSQELIQSLLQDPSQWKQRLENTNQQVKELVKDLDFSSELVFLNIANNFAQLLDTNTKTHRREHHQLLLNLIGRFTEHLRRKIDRNLEDNAEVYWRLTLIDLALANIRGLFVDEVIYFRSLDALDEYEYRQWLRKHGAREKSVNSAFIRVLYDLVYGFPEGNTNNPKLAAGTAIRILITILFQYNGAIMWKMQAGMGETVITPLYQVLKRRGVKFSFFHVVEELHLDDDQKSIASIKVARQVNLKNPQHEYEPLIEVKGLSCWPSLPLYDQIVDREAKKLQAENIDLESYWTSWENVEEIKLNKGKDFDIVLLGMSLSPLANICHELLDAEKNPASKKWRNMVNQVKTVTTQGGQLWLKPTLSQLGWNLSSPVLGAYVEPLDVYADMSELSPRENWPAEQYPYNIAYFTGVIPDPEIPPASDHAFPDQEQKKIAESAINFLENNIGHLWPDATRPDNPQGLNWELLVDLQNRKGIERFKSQYWRVNINPSERYVLSVPGSTKYRLKTDQSGFDNLYLAGDWINNGYNSGCVEATVISAMQATRAILLQCFGIRYNKEIIHESDSWI